MKIFNLTAADHRHSYVEIERFYAPPLKSFQSTSGIQEVVEAVMFGVTTLVYKCSGCGDIKTVRAPGSRVETRPTFIMEGNTFHDNTWMGCVN